jgi:hypothetical protein
MIDNQRTSENLATNLFVYSALAETRDRGLEIRSLEATLLEHRCKRAIGDCLELD